MDPQSQLEKLSSARGSGQARIGILATRPSCFPGLRRVHFSRVERHDWSRGGYKPPGKVGTGFVFVLLQPWWCQPSWDRGTTALAFVATRPSGGVRLVGTARFVPADRSLATDRASRGLALRVPW